MPWHNPAHGSSETVRLCNRAEPGGAKGQEVCCKEPRDERGEAVHLCGVDWYRPGGAIYSAPDWIQELQVREEVRRAIAAGLGTEVQGGVQEQRGSAGGGGEACGADAETGVGGLAELMGGCASVGCPLARYSP